MAEFEMHGLRAQLNPHFMFNSLNAIQEQILKEDTENASTYLTTFARMLRQLLENAEFAFVPLQKELEFLKRYLMMEQLRLPDMQYHFYVDPAIDTSTAMIPNMILQPYLENAIWHGLSPKQGDKYIEVAIHHKNDGISIQITDNGIGRNKAAEMKSKYRKTHQSKGMELLQKRFELIKIEFGSQIQIDIEDLKEGSEPMGTKVSLFIPHAFSDPMRKMYGEIINN
jgi:LytS/YehU family sensor histidine kinase